MTVLESLFNKVAGLKACNFIKKKLQHRCFPVNLVLGATFLQNTPGRLLLEMPCRICCCDFPCCNNIKVEGTSGDTWILLILLGAIFNLI